MDVKTKRTEAEEMMKSSAASKFNEMKKSCIDCHTTRTPLWRGGPAGPRSLCNACGIRYRKTKKLALLGLDKGRPEKRKRKHCNYNNRKSATKLGISLEAGLMAVGNDLGEEEQAAILLMSLSHGRVYA